MRRFLGQLPWYAMQISIVGLVVYAITEGSKFSPEKEPPNVGLAFGVGVVFALIATGIVAKILDLLLIARVALSRRLNGSNELPSQSLGLPPANGSGRDGPKQIPRALVRKYLR